MQTPRIGTLAVHAGEGETLAVPSVTTPVYQATTYRFPDAAEAAAYLDRPEGRWLYSRLENPTVLAAERKVAALEGAESAACFASGMAAISASLRSALRAGDALLLSDALYGETTRLAREVLARFGVEVRAVPVAGLPEAVRAAPANARALLFETPTNPTLRVVDVPAVAAACRARGLASVLDATFATPVNLRALEHGVDLVVHSATKYLNGHCDHLCGAVAGRRGLVEAAVRVRRSTGGDLGPAAAHGLLPGMQTPGGRGLRPDPTPPHPARAPAAPPPGARGVPPLPVAHPPPAPRRMMITSDGPFTAMARTPPSAQLRSRGPIRADAPAGPSGNR